MSTTTPAFGKFRTLLAEHNIGVTAGYELINAGLLTTFKIGKAVYAEREQFATLPGRLKAPEAQARLAAVKRAAKAAA